MPDVHAAMLRDIGRLPWLGVPLEVVGGSNHHQAPIRSDPDRDHVLAERLAQPDAQALLQQPHGVAERRGRHPQANSCLGEALLLCHHQEGLQVVGLHAAHGSIVSSTQ
ncbi:hypothetical protein D3C73_1351960 [compost metagenome]